MRNTLSLLSLALTVASVVACGDGTDVNEVPGTRVSAEALKGGCRWDCPSCKPHQPCPAMACTLECKGKKQPCGESMCDSGEFCCNESCGICAPEGGSCTEQYCPPSDGCNVMALCVEGYVWSETDCACVPQTSVECATDADCRLFSDYCTGCDCRVLSNSDPDPTCDGPGVRCFADPCGGQSAVCLGGTCMLQLSL